MNWHLFFSIYVLIFVAELPDKTAFATLLLATRSKPIPVFIGVAAAFLVQTVVAVLFGSLIALLPAPYVHLFAGLLFLFFAVQMWRSRFESEELPVNTNGDGTLAQAARKSIGFWSVGWSAFLVIFIAEWGDLTQVMTGSLIAKYPSDKLTVFFAALLALWSVTLAAVLLGRHAKHLINPTEIKKYGAVLFALVGVYFLFVAARDLVS